MRPVRLVMRAFGPYASEQVIDFRDLSAATLFLIHGPTGSGKTSIVDAMCFALFGETSGGERKAGEMRSHRADSATLTEVIFDFSIGADSYRVRRVPEQERPKKRGAGVTREPYSATLWRRTGLTDDATEGVVLETQWSEVTGRTEQLLGFEVAQFRQVVVLPQGKFRDFLMANSRTRQEILEVLFQTSFYRLIEEALKDEAGNIRTDVESRRERIRLILEQAGVVSVAALETRREALATERAGLEAELTNLRSRETNLDRQHKRALGDEARFRELEEATAAKATLDARAAQMTESQARLEAARKAASLDDVDVALAQRGREQAEALAKREAAERELAKAATDAQAAKAALERELGRTPEREQAQERLHILQALRNRVGQLDAARRALTQHEADLVQCITERDAAKSGLAKCERQLKAAHQQIGPLREAAGALAAHRTEAREWTRMIGVARQISEDRERLKGAKAEQRSADGARDRAKAALDEAIKERDGLERRWFKGQAAVLANQLADGKPCPVCGSTRHPAKARGYHDVPSEEQVNETRQRAENCRKLFDEARQSADKTATAVTTIQSRIADREEALGEYRATTLTKLEQLLAEAREQMNRAEGAKTQAAELTERIEALTKQESPLKADIERLTAQHERLLASKSAAEAKVEQLQADVPETLRSLNALEKEIGEAQQALQRLNAALDQAREREGQAQKILAARTETLTAARNAEALAKEALDASRRVFSARLVEAGFATGEQYRAARLGVTELDALARAVEGYRTQCASASERLARAQDATKDLTRPEMEAITIRLSEVRSQIEQALQKSAALSSHIDQVQQQLTDLKTAMDEATAAEGRYAVMGRIAEVANGKNAHGITLQRYVLAALLDDVLAAASERLRIMSQGRFQLHRARERTDLRATGGLDLEIFDAYSGSSRPAHTLSGGEQFLASLSLALGLADVVQGYAGGIRLETIFIDEGFGSLDPETLEYAFRALVELQKSGRLVGVISHMSGLKELIPARLAVMPKGDGTSTAHIVL